MDLIIYWYANNVTQILTTVNLYIYTTSYNQVVSYYAPKFYRPKIVKILITNTLNYSDFQSYKVHLSPILAPPAAEEKDKLLILEGVGGGVLVPGLMTICCKTQPSLALSLCKLLLIHYP